MSKKVAVLCTLVISVVGIIVYLPALKIGFYDGWWYLRWAATMNLPRYLIQFLDPANITQGYRPVQGLYIYLLYHLFGFNPDGYHLAHTVLHAANAVLLFFIIVRLGKNLRVALASALIYVVSPVISLAVFWHAVVDPLSGFFYLLTILFWIRYLERRRRLFWALAFFAFALALFSKEIGIFLPIIMFLIDWWFFGNKPDLRAQWPRYVPFLLVLPPFLWLVTQVQSHGEFSSQFGFRLGPHMFGNLLPYLAVLALPWTLNLPEDTIYFVWLAAVIIAYLAVMVYKRSTLLLFLAIVAVLNISPLTAFPLDFFNTRYLYMSMMVSATVLALLFEVGWRLSQGRRAFGVAMTLLVGLFVVVSGMRVAEASAELAEYTRQVRVPFRDISSQHPTFPPNTFLYFVYSPTTSVWDFEGLFFVRYGEGVKVESTETGNQARLRDHQSAFVYYFDPTGRPIEVKVDKDLTLMSAPALPVRFEAPFTLEQFQVPSTNLERGKALVLLVEWRPSGSTDRDYTLFAHLVDENGKMVTSWDGPPRRGKGPTSMWRPNQLVVDTLVLPIPQDAPLGDRFRLEFGMYEAETMERLSIVDSNGRGIGDKIVIEPFRILR